MHHCAIVMNSDSTPANEAKRPSDAPEMTPEACRKPVQTGRSHAAPASRRVGYPRSMDLYSGRNMKHVRSLKAVMFISGGLTALLLGACNDSDSGPLSTENPMTPNKLAERIVQKNHSQNTNNPLTS